MQENTGQKKLRIWTLVTQCQNTIIQCKSLAETMKTYVICDNQFKNVLFGNITSSFLSVRKVQLDGLNGQEGATLKNPLFLILCLTV